MYYQYHVITLCTLDEHFPFWIGTCMRTLLVVHRGRHSTYPGLLYKVRSSTMNVKKRISTPITIILPQISDVFCPLWQSKACLHLSAKLGSTWLKRQLCGIKNKFDLKYHLHSEFWWRAVQWLGLCRHWRQWGTLADSQSISFLVYTIFLLRKTGQRKTFARVL